MFGNAASAEGALRVTFDGWIARVGAAPSTARLPEREYCSLAGVLAAALSLSELFLSFAGINMEATRRIVGLSLWQPDLDIGDPEALGIPVDYLPRELWVLGLGHLGNAYLWVLASLAYPKRDDVTFALCDFDKVEPENIETGVIFTAADERRLKTRAGGCWLEQRGFQTRLVERRFDANFRRSYLRTKICCRRTRFSASSDARDRNNPTSSDQSNLQASHIGLQDHPIRSLSPPGRHLR